MLIGSNGLAVIRGDHRITGCNLREGGRPPLSDESDHMLINPGDKSRGICRCKCMQPTTATLKDMRFEDIDQFVVQNVLVFVCDACNNNVSIPAQEIKKNRRR